MQTVPTEFLEWSRHRQALLEERLQNILPAPEIAPGRLHAAMRYAVLGGGKRVRPLLACAAGEVAGASLERTLLAGAAVELIHAYSLVHDDLPCMDDDVLRRGKPTCHVEYDEATALLVGDALQLGVRCGKRLDEAQSLHIDHFAKCIGLAFQVVDDILDTESNTATLGKTAGKDARSDKPTYVSALGVAGAKSLARDLREDAMQALASFGDRAVRLRQLADFIVMREF